MVLRLVQILALGFLIAVAALHFATVGFVDVAGSVFEAHWRETLFGCVAVIAAWLFVITHGLRPVVAIFAAAAFFVVALMDEPSTDSLLATIDGITERALAGIEGFREG